MSVKRFEVATNCCSSRKHDHRFGLDHASYAVQTSLERFSGEVASDHTRYQLDAHQPSAKKQRCSYDECSDGYSTASYAPSSVQPMTRSNLDLLLMVIDTMKENEERRHTSKIMSISSLLDGPGGNDEVGSPVLRSHSSSPVSSHGSSSEAPPLSVCLGGTFATVFASNGVDPGMWSTLSNKIQQMIRDYLTDSQSRSDVLKVSWRHSKLAQRSYGTEKRFISPPPLVSVNSNDSEAQFPTCSVSIDINGHSTSVQDCGDQQFAFKQLHVSPGAKDQHSNSTMKDKSFSLNFCLERMTSKSVQFQTSPIAIISKPAKKTSKSKSVTLGIQNGDKIALFSRINSQTARTRFAKATTNGFIACNSSWDALCIRLVHSSQENQNDGGIAYDSVVTLSSHNTTTGPMFIRKMNKNTIEHVASTDSSCIVGQLQKVAFEVAEFNPATLSYIPTGKFWGCTDVINSKTRVPFSTPYINDYGPITVSSSVTNGGSLDDNLSWTLVSVSEGDMEMMVLNHDASVVVPQLTEIPQTKNSCISFNGVNLGNCQVWMGTSGPLPIITRTNNTLTVSCSQYRRLHCVLNQNNSNPHSLFLVTPEVIINTGYAAVPDAI